jgi:cytochrome b subunit of formate dehydrogenase
MAEPDNHIINHQTIYTTVITNLIGGFSLVLAQFLWLLLKVITLALKFNGIFLDNWIQITNDRLIFTNRSFKS